MTLLGDSMLMLPWDRCNLMHHFISKIVMFTVAHQGKMMSPPKLFLCQWNKELTALMCFVTKMTVGRYITQCCSLQKKWRCIAVQSGNSLQTSVLRPHGSAASRSQQEPSRSTTVQRLCPTASCYTETLPLKEAFEGRSKMFYQGLSHLARGTSWQNYILAAI